MDTVIKPIQNKTISPSTLIRPNAALIPLEPTILSRQRTITSLNSSTKHYRGISWTPMTTSITFNLNTAKRISLTSTSRINILKAPIRMKFHLHRKNRYTVLTILRLLEERKSKSQISMRDQPIHMKLRVNTSQLIKKIITTKKMTPIQAQLRS